MASESVVIYQFKITLKHSKPPIWRSIQVPSNYNFHQFHVAIQRCMGWVGYHLHEFTIRKFGEIVRIGVPFEDDFEPCQDEQSILISEYFVQPKDKGVYTYDFGDGWDHSIVLEKVLTPLPCVKYPICVAGRRAGPPEDSGGVAGYEEILNILKNPAHKEFVEIKRWIKEMKGANFNSEVFDPRSVVFN